MLSRNQASEATSVPICESSLVLVDRWFRTSVGRGSLDQWTVPTGYYIGIFVSGRFHCREGSCFNYGLDQLLVVRWLILFGRKEGELSAEELFLVWRSERFRKNKIGLLRGFLYGSLVVLRYLLWDSFTTISSLSSLFWEKFHMMISGRRGNEVLAEAIGGYDRANVKERAITAASTEGRNHAIHVSGEGYKMRAFSSFLMGHGNGFEAQSNILDLIPFFRDAVDTKRYWFCKQYLIPTKTFVFKLSGPTWLFILLCTFVTMDELDIVYWRKKIWDTTASSGGALLWTLLSFKILPGNFIIIDKHTDKRKIADDLERDHPRQV
ncbi:hypothetical protein V6N11_017893 [Hibiscus sabdariffa]|uniref:Uncharacterized protein n=1 Tax=Hibiscus sabdariffa TaxID=183260 RepID=A0ABR2T5T1_9ROSI